jgi:hypothetical protein
MSMQQTQQHFPLGAHQSSNTLVIAIMVFMQVVDVSFTILVLHYFQKASYQITSIQRFARGKPIYTRNYPSPRYKAKAIVRMRSRMHENHYHLIINNCEHLCTWAITGIESSIQVERMQRRLATIGYISSVMSYMNSLMLTVATACFALVLYIKMMLRRQAKKSLPAYLLLREKLKNRNSFKS